MISDDMRLVQEFAASQSESAFATLVQRHIGLVHSAALRQLDNPHMAEEITQAVFVLLSRKAASLGPKTILAAWLYRTTRYAAADALKAQRRRQAREQEAHMQSTLNQPDDVWIQLAPLLDDAMAELGETDRAALVLRFFENKTTREIAGSLRMEEATAQKRIARALEKLRAIFVNKGVTLSATLIASAVAANSVQAAPVGLAVTVTAVAAKGAAVSSSTLTLIKGALKIMAWTKAKTAIVAVVAITAAVGTPVIVKEFQRPVVKEAFPWQTFEDLSPVWLEKAPPLLKIVPTKFAQGGRIMTMVDSKGVWRATGRACTIEDLLVKAHDAKFQRTVVLSPLPQARYDFISTVAGAKGEALQRAIKKLGFIGTFKTLKTNVLILTVKEKKAGVLNVSTNEISYLKDYPGDFAITNTPLSAFVDMVADRFRIPILDRTGLTKNYDLALKWDEYGPKVGNQNPIYPNLGGFKQALLDQLGLDLVPANTPIEMLVIEKVK